MMAAASTASPRATAGRIARRCVSLPASRIVSAPSTPELKKGPGTGPRPSSSNSTAASVSELSLPPYSAGTRMPGQPASTALRQRSGTRLDSWRCKPTSKWVGASRSTNVRAAARSISCDSVRARSMLVHRPHRLACAAADPDPARHAHALHVRGAAGVHGHDAVALLQLEEPFGRAPGGIRRERRRADGLEDGAGHPEPGHLAVVRQLRALVRAWSLGVGQPEVAQTEQPLDLGLDVDVGQQVARVRMLRVRHAVALGLLAVADQPIPHAVTADAAAGAVLQLQMRAGRLPAIVLAADQRERGHA